MAQHGLCFAFEDTHKLKSTRSHEARINLIQVKQNLHVAKRYRKITTEVFRN